MKLKIVLFLIIGFILGYIVGNITPLAIFQFLGSVRGENELRIIALVEGKPINNLEINVGQRLGPPPKGGVVFTNENGIATFYLKAGKYYLYFNAANFPQHLEYPEPRGITVEKGKINEYTINLKPK